MWSLEECGRSVVLRVRLASPAQAARNLGNPFERTFLRLRFLHAPPVDQAARNWLALPRAAPFLLADRLTGALPACRSRPARRRRLREGSVRRAWIDRRSIRRAGRRVSRAVGRRAAPNRLRRDCVGSALVRTGPAHLSRPHGL